MLSAQSGARKKKAWPKQLYCVALRWLCGNLVCLGDQQPNQTTYLLHRNEANNNKKEQKTNVQNDQSVPTVWDITSLPGLTISVWILWPCPASQQQIMCPRQAVLSITLRLPAFSHLASEQHSSCHAAFMFHSPFHNHTRTLKNYQKSTWPGTLAKGRRNANPSAIQARCPVNKHGDPNPSHHQDAQRSRCGGTIWSWMSTPFSQKWNSTNAAGVHR